MEPNQPVPPPGNSLFEMELDMIGQNHLNNISKWGKFISITLLIIVGIFILFMAVQFSKVVDQIAQLFALDNSVAGVVLVLCFIIIGLFVLLLFFLLRASILIKQGLVSQNIERITEGFKALKAVLTIRIIFAALSLLSVIFTLSN